MPEAELKASLQPRMNSPALEPGLLVLHSNRTELLGEAVFEWLRRHPLAPLEEEIFLVQSNGMAEWLKMTLASQSGIFAVARVELPARFMWRAYRQVLGRQAVPAASKLDKLPLTWRLMQCLPGLVQRPGFERLAGFLQGDDSDRLWQLSRRLADLYDQYQVYRSDWLDGWAAGFDTVARGEGVPAAAGMALASDQRWQPALWRELLSRLSAADRLTGRPQLQRRFLDTLQLPAALAAAAAAQTHAAPVTRRVVLFGMTQLPTQTLQALAALSRHCQVVMAVPNPCRYHWADAIAGRELMKAGARRMPLRGGRDLGLLALEDMHAHAHPLLAAWGRQGRDFLRQLDAFDNDAQQQQTVARVELFDESAGETLLQQVQAHIRDLLPLAEHPVAMLEATDRSIVFHIAHSVQREVEILHDQLLDLLALPSSEAARPLSPRDVVVMVPDIEPYTAAIRSVFGQYARSDPRFIPFDIADLRERGNSPLLVALEWLLRLPQQRATQSQLRDLLEVPAIAARFGLQGEDLGQLSAWMAGAGMRWGLDEAHRVELGLAACGDQNSLGFGLDRLLLGYASGRAAGSFGGIEPFGDIGGLDAAMVGSLATLIDALSRWRNEASSAATPAGWAARCSRLIEDFFAATDEAEQLIVAALHDALRAWLEACELASFDGAVPLTVAREAWLEGVDDAGLGRRFTAGGVTFCTLLPMRALPFEVVCLLGMNEGDYPRQTQRSDFDLMGQAGLARPGDRSRREDDRQLMLEALLSARRVLYLGWTGRSVRDNSIEPPSVLVSQLRDYLGAGWGAEAVEARTTEHPLQPFSRRYFESAAGALHTHAREWRAAHTGHVEAATGRPGADASPSAAFEPDPAVPLTLAVLTRFLKNPVKAFFRSQLDVVFRDAEAEPDDDETFDVQGLDEYQLLDSVLQPVVDRLVDGASLCGVVAKNAADDAALRSMLADEAARLRRAGRLPMAGIGLRHEAALVDILLPVLGCWQAWTLRHPGVAAKELLHFEQAGVVLQDWLDGLRPAAAVEAQSNPAAMPVWLQLLPGRICSKTKTKALAPEKLVDAWLRTLAAAASGLCVRGVVVGRDSVAVIEAMPADEARAVLGGLLQAWRDGMSAPLPLAVKTALALLTSSDPAKAAAVYEGNERTRGEVEEPCLARLYPDFEALARDGRFGVLAERIYGPLQRWAQGSVKHTLHAAASQAPAGAADDDD